MQNQPRISLGVVLKEVGNKVEGVKTREEFIDACLAKDQTLINGDVLKVSAGNFEKLLEVLSADEAARQKSGDRVHRFRVYLSECIRLQYHANACILEHTEPIMVQE